jgi:hypothetical protein
LKRAQHPEEEHVRERQEERARKPAKARVHAAAEEGKRGDCGGLHLDLCFERNLKVGIIPEILSVYDFDWLKWTLKVIS